MPPPPAIAYGIVLLLWFVTGLIKGRLHFNYVYFEDRAAGSDDSFLNAFGFDLNKALDQRYVFPYPPEVDHASGTEKEVLFRQIKRLNLVLWGLWMLVLSPLVFS